MAYDEGGAASLFEGGDAGTGGGSGDAGAGGAADGQGQGDGSATGGGQGEGGQGGQAAADWLNGFSADTIGDAPSHRDYLTAKGFKDANAIVDSYRELERQLSGKGVVKVPGADASDAEKAAWRTATGVPESADKYEVAAAPEGMELDVGFLDPMRQAAFEAGVSGDGFKTLADKFVAHQLDQLAAERTRQDGLKDAKLREWGNDRDRNVALAQRGFKSFGLSIDDVASLQRGLGSDRMLDLALKMGQVGAEDGLLGGGKPGGGFGIASKAEAQAKMDALIADPVKSKAVYTKGSPERAEYDRLNQAIAFFTDREQQQ